MTAAIVERVAAGPGARGDGSAEDAAVMVAADTLLGMP
jgi:hypothetical protein